MREQITGDTWRSCLAREYQTQARIQLRTGRHWDEATPLAAKGRAALDGQPVAPAPARPALSGVRETLDRALTHSSERPCECAKAQARYDGWSVAVDRGMDTAPFAKAFEEAVSACTAPR